MNRDEAKPALPRDVKLKADQIAKKHHIPFLEALKVATGKERLGDLLRRLMEEEKARKLAAQHGLGFFDALAVAQGKSTIEEAKAITARKEEARKLAAQHTLAPAVAQKVVAGEMTLEAALATRQRRDDVHRMVREHGLPAPLAGQVASGRFSMDQAKQFRMQKEKMRTLVKEHAIPPSLAGQVARNRLTLGKALCISHMKETLDKNAQRSCLVEAFEAQRPLVLCVHPQRRLEGLVTEVTKYNFKFRANGAEAEIELFKHEAKLGYSPEDAAQVEGALVKDEAVAALNLSPIVHRRERKLIKNEFLQTLVDDKARMTMTLLEGEKFAGRIEWFGFWEFGFVLDNGTKVTVFRHAIQDLLTDHKAQQLKQQGATAGGVGGAVAAPAPAPAPGGTAAPESAAGA